MKEKFSPYAFITTWDRKVNDQIGLLKDLKAIFCYAISIGEEKEKLIEGNMEGILI